jgi:hypothetical protein
MLQEQDLGQDNVDWIRKISRPDPESDKDAPVDKSDIAM